MLPALHVIFGTVALLVVPAALVARKGGDWHRRWGIGFHRLDDRGALHRRLHVAGEGASLSRPARPGERLSDIQRLARHRAPRAARTGSHRRSRRPGGRPWRHRRRVRDRLSRAHRRKTPLLLSIRPALIGIGSIAICFGLNEMLGFYAPRTRSGWLLAHLSAMLAAYISASTAFLVINAHQRSDDAALARAQRDRRGDDRRLLDPGARAGAERGPASPVAGRTGVPCRRNAFPGFRRGSLRRTVKAPAIGRLLAPDIAPV